MNFLNTTKPNTSTSIWRTKLAEIDSRDFVFFGPYIGHIDRSVVIPEGEEGLLFMREFLRENHRPKAPGDTAFMRGFMGFIDYDLGAQWNGVIASAAKQSLFPDAHFVYVDRVFVLPAHVVIPANAGIYDTSRTYGSQINSGMTKERYLEKILRIKNHLFAGDTYQVNFSQRFEAPYDGDAFELYQRVTAINPSPFPFFMETDDFAVISNSPERLFKLQNGILETRPIKGTMPRGKTAEEDIQNIKKLLSSKKERAELAMIVDLERNDLGKLCETGTVEVNEDRVIEKYSHVIHTVSNVRGVLSQQYDWYDALKALFPGGSVTGAPKKRTMEIIAELEGEPRGVYCGTAGWIDLSGECDFNILIRTLWLEKKGNGGILTFRSGGGIVVDSDAEKEYEETLHKAAALMQAIMLN